MPVLTTVENGDGETEAEFHWLDVSGDFEPETVGVYDHTEDDRCQCWSGEEIPERCDGEASHTLVEWAEQKEQLIQLAVCDDHGFPDLVGKQAYRRVRPEDDDD